MSSELTQRLPVVAATRTDSDRGNWQWTVSLASLALLAVGLLGWAAGCDAAKWTGFVLYALVGFGAAWLVVLRLPGWAHTLAAPVGLSFTILVGFFLVETHIWSIGLPLFVTFLAATGMIHAYVLLRPALTGDLSARKQQLRRKWNDLVTNVTTIDQIVVGLSLLGMFLCFLSSSLLNNFDPTNPSAFFGAVSPGWYLGAICVIGAVVLGLVTSRMGAVVLSVIALELVLSMSVSLAYSEPHSSWAAKHVGVTLYMMRYGLVNTKIDIYQAWPGLFSGVGWVCKSIGNLDPMEVARWWPPVTGLATVAVFQRLGREALHDSRRAWIATVVLIIGNTIGQTYFSPQATGFLLAIAFYALAYRRLKNPRRLSLPEWAVVCALSLAVAVTHQLTPYMVTGVMVVLVLFGRARSRVLPLIAFVPAAVWALVNLSIVRRYFGGPSQIGNVFYNILPPGFSRAVFHKSELIRADSYAMAADALIIGVIALAVLLQHRSKSHMAWALSAFSGAGLFLVNSYGNEGSFRVVLFALPWLGLLFADWNGVSKRQLVAIPLVAISVLYGLYLFANLGIDYIRAVRPGDVAAIRTFERTAPAKSKLFILGYSFAPIQSSARYGVLHYGYYPYIETGTNSGPRFRAGVAFDEFLAYHIPTHTATLKRQRIYVLGAAEPEAAMEQDNVITGADYQAMVNEFSGSPNWKLVKKTSTAELFELESVVANVSRPVAKGNANVGQRLIASHGSWGTLNPLRYSYQWERCSAGTIHYSNATCTPIPGATGNSYLVAPAEQGRRIAVVVKAEDTRGVSARAPSATTGVVGHAPVPHVVSAPSIAGRLETGNAGPTK